MTQTASSGRSRTASLPAPIGRVLGRLRRRLRVASLLRGVGWLALIATIGAVAGMGVDFAVPLPRTARWTVWGVWLAALAATAVIALLRPLFRPAAAFDLAAVAERAHPQLGERLTGVVALVKSPAHGSTALIAALADQAAAEVPTIDAARAIPWRRPARWCALGLMVLGLAAAPAALWPATYGMLAQRFLAPWADLDPISRFVIRVAPGDRVAAIGSDLTVHAQVQPRFGNFDPPGSAWLEWAEAGREGGRASGPWQRVAMPAETSGSAASVAPAGSFAVTLPRLGGSVLYRVASGPALSRTHRITALEPPAVAALGATVEPPAYTRLPSAKVDNPRRIDAWEGSRVTLKIRASRPVTAITVDWPAPADREKTAHEGREPSADALARHVAATMAADPKSGTVTVNAEVSGPFHMTLRDVHGLESRPETQAKAAQRLNVLVDSAPVVSVAGSDTTRESNPSDSLVLGVAARDDFAVASVELHYTIKRGGGSTTEAEAPRAAPALAPETGHVDAPLPGLTTRLARGQARLELASLNLKPGDSLAYRVRVADNRPGPRGPNVTWSLSQALSIVAQAPSLLARQSEAERARLQAKLDEIKQAAAANRRETEQLRYAADAAQRGNGHWEPQQQQALVQIEGEARGVADRLQLLARELADEAEAALRALARPARQIAEVEAESSRAMLDQARRAGEAPARLNDLRQADHRLAAVVQRLDELQHQFDAAQRRQAENQRLRELAGREETLAGRAETPLPRLQAEQNALQQDLDTLLARSPELRGEALAGQAGEADALAKKAHALAERQRDEARRSGDVSAPELAGMLKELAEAQRTLEEDARRLALDVDTPLSDSGRGRLNTAVVHDAVAPLERGDLDQARQRLEGAEVELRRLARDLDDVPADPKALAQRLVRRQDALNAQVNEALRPFQGKPEPSDEEKAARAAQLKPLAQRQEEIARLAAAIAPAPPQAGSESRKWPIKEALDAAQQNTAQAVEALRNEALANRDITMRQARAHATLQNLAATLPDPSARRAAAQRPLDEARRSSGDVARDLERLLRENKPGSDDELARKLEPLLKKQAKAAEALDAMEAGRRDAPQQHRAQARLRAVTEALEALSAADPPAERKQALRAALPGLQAEARAALDRLDQKLGGRVPADDLAAELTEEQRALRDRMTAAAVAAAPADPATVRDQTRIATALRNLEVPDAEAAKREAIRRAERAAAALEAAPPDRDPAAVAVAAASTAAEVLAAHLAREPGAAAKDPTSLPSPRTFPSDPELGLTSAHTVTAEQLARRQRQLRERLQAVLAERIAPQQALRAESEALGRQLADLRDRARPLSERSRGPAQEAAQTLGEQAPRAMDQGTDRLAQGRAAAARDAQRQAAAVVERGAQQAEDLAAALRADGRQAANDQAQAQGQAPAPGEAAPGAEAAPPPPLAAARAAMRQAAQQLGEAQAQNQGQPPGGDAANSAAARQSMRQAARDLRTAADRGAAGQAAATPGGTPPGAGTPGESDSTDPEGTLAGAGTPDLSELKAMIAHKTGRAWGELPGHLRTEILQMSQGRYRDDYARIIQLYFREIAAGAASAKPR